MKPTDKIKIFLDTFRISIKKLDKKQWFLISSISVFVVLVFFSSIFYFRNTEVVASYGGSYTEGVIGSPRFINPIYVQKSEADNDLTRLLFAGLMKYDKNNEVVPYLIENIENTDSRIFEATLRDDIYWSDGEKITAEDIIFTIEKIKNRSVQSPLKISWEGIRVEKLSEKKVRFLLESPSPLFIEKLTINPIPEHVWKDVDPADFQFSELNLNATTSGPYKIDSINKKEEVIKSISLTENPYYFDKKPYIENIEFKFFENEKELIDGKKRLDGFVLPSIKSEVNTSFNEHAYHLPRYFAIFFNMEKINENTRKALAYAINKEEILKGLEKVRAVNSPAIPEFYGIEEPEIKYETDLEKATDLLEEEGYQRNEDGYFEKIIRQETSFEFTERMKEDDQGEEVRELQRCFVNIREDDKRFFPDGEITGYFDFQTKEAVNDFQEMFKEDILEPHGFENPTGIVAASTRSKLNELCGGKIPEKKEFLSIEITTIDHPLLSRVVKKVTNQWSEAGIKVEKKTKGLQVIEKEVIEDKNFESFLFGKAMSAIPDPFRWWHSSQVEKPGLNFTNYQNAKVDTFITRIITSPNKEERVENMEKFQNELLEDKPAIFLYSPHYLHMVNDKVKGVSGGKIINSSERFRDIKDWHINTKRIWKNN